MTQQIAINTGMRVIGGAAPFSVNPLVTTVTQTGIHTYENTLDIPTTSTGTALPVGASIATLGWAEFENLDPTNYIEVGHQVSGTFYSLWRLLPGDPPAQLPLTPGVTYYARANVATASLYYAILER